jgi:alpha-tubulin suppressor-like RCC1 family protein
MTPISGKSIKDIDYGYYHSIALMTDGTVYGCGWNDYGQQGDGTTNPQFSLKQVTLPTGKVAQSIKCGQSFTTINMTDGTVYACGQNNFGQLGDGTTTNSSSFVKALVADSLLSAIDLLKLQGYTATQMKALGYTATE